MAHVLEQLAAAGTPASSWSDLEHALDGLGTRPHPWVAVSDEWGNLIRAEGLNGAYRLEARSVDAEGVRWWGLGNAESPGTQVSLRLSGRAVKVAPTERLTLEDVKTAFKTVIEGGALPDSMPRRALSGEHGRLYMMVVGNGDEPRPTVGWSEIARRLTSVADDEALISAISEPGRVLIGVFGKGDQLTITVREYRGSQSWERRICHQEGAAGLVQLKLPQGDIEVPGRQVLSKDDMMTVVESLYRFDTPAPGFTWVLA